MILLALAPVAAVGGYMTWGAFSSGREWFAEWMRTFEVGALVAVVLVAIVGVASLGLILGAFERSGALAVLPATWARIVGRVLTSFERLFGIVISGWNATIGAVFTAAAKALR